MHLDACESILFKYGLMIDNAELHILILVQMTLTLIQDHRNVRKHKLLCHFSPRFRSVWMEIDMLFRLVGLMKPMFILSCPINIQW